MLVGAEWIGFAFAVLFLVFFLFSLGDFGLSVCFFMLMIVFACTALFAAHYRVYGDRMGNEIEKRYGYEVLASDTDDGDQPWSSDYGLVVFRDRNDYCFAKTVKVSGRFLIAKGSRECFAKGPLKVEHASDARMAYEKEGEFCELQFSRTDGPKKTRCTEGMEWPSTS